MSNKLLSMFELLKNNYPINEFYAIDLKNIKPEEAEQALTDGLRNFRSRSKSRLISIRTGLAGKPETRLFMSPALDAKNDELIINEMKKALINLSKEHGGYSNGFIILQDWTPEEEYLFSINIAPVNKEFIIEAGKGNHLIINREAPTIIKMNNKEVRVIKNNLQPDELTMLQRLTKQLINNYLLKNNNTYELSFTKKGPSFYQIKNPKSLINKPLSKEEFYNELNKKGINYKNRILM